MLVIIVAMSMLYFLTQQLEDISIFQRAARSDPGSSNSALTQAREALLGYAITYRDDHPTEVFGYLPCPDRDGDGISDPNSDGFCATADGKAEIGLFPYKTLGLPDLRDTEGGCLWYAVAGNFKAVPSGTKAIMNWDTQGQFSILGSDSAARTPAPDVSGGEGGAAAVVFAAGTPIGTQSRRPTGSLPCRLNMRSVNPDASANPNPTQVADYLDGNYNFAVTTTIPITQGIVIDSGGNITNNDLLVWITPKQIFDRIKRRSDFVTAINALSSSLATSLAPATPGAPLLSHDGGGTPVGSSKLVGKFPAATGVPAIPVNYQTYRDNWRDMYRYVRCTPSSPTNKCLNVNGQSCMGTLVFAGQHATSGPRTTADKANDATYIDSGGNYSAYTTSGANSFAGAASFAMADPSQLATQDVLYCLNTLDVTAITGTSGFTAAASSPLVSSFAGSSRLGTSVIDFFSARSACTWSPTAVDFFNGLSVYFRLNVNTRDAGLSFVVADATNNPSTVNLCGGIGTDGRLLGYAGTHASGNRIKAPKIGLELDTRRDATLATDPDFAVTLLNRHAAIVYWGTTASNDDDNTHGAGTAASSTQPLNPSSAPGVVTESFTNLTAYHVRLDIQRTYAAPVGTYAVTAYIYLTSDPSTLACRSLLSDPTSLADFFVNVDTGGLCIPTITDTITINDSLTAGNEAMKKVFLGFTTGQRAGRSQDITIGNFAAQNH
ncbi:MAG: hypothetical protein NTW45_08520 [Rhodocyclales bacterium]|nr:hypothetical protein [Rhodocyclales bacterium]